MFVTFIFRHLFLGRSVEKTSKWLIVEVLYLDQEDLKQSQSDGEKWRDRKLYSLQKETIGCISPLRAESTFWPTMPSRKQRGYQKYDPGGDHYYVGCLGQTRVPLPE